ncbi:MAG: DnaJ domain-containing protein [Candidatus Hodgkinia cicadicola]
MKCPYEVLGITRDATEAQIKAAYRKLALKLHPDRNVGSRDVDKRFKEVNEAYEVLRNPAKKSQYDRFGSQTGYSRDPFEDLFADTPFSSKTGRVKGRNITLLYAAGLRQLSLGDSVSLSFNTKIECEACGGRGKTEALSSVNCSECGGKGVLRRKQGFIVFEQTCFTCKGSGVSDGDVCVKCGAEGRIVGKRSALLSIRAGIGGTTTKFEGLGEAGSKSAAAGDLYVKLVEKPHIFYARCGADLLCSLAVDPLTAVLGGRLEVKTPAGRHLVVVVPPLTDAVTKLAVKQRGLMGATGLGNLLLKLTIGIRLQSKSSFRFSISRLALMFMLSSTLNRALSDFTI